MENRHRISSIPHDDFAEPDLETPVYVLADIIRQVRTLRNSASEHDLKMVAYLLHMAEIEATDMLADATSEISLEKH